MASWYPKWFNSWFKNWFSKSGPTTPVEPPITPTSPPIAPRAPADSPSLLSGVRDAVDREFKLSKDAPPICVEFDDPLEDIPKITKPELGCTPVTGGPPQDTCGNKYPRKITVSWEPVGNGVAAIEYPDWLFSFFNKWPPLEGTPYWSSRVVGNEATHAISSLNFIADPFAEQMIQGAVDAGITLSLAFSGAYLPPDLYTLEAVKLGPDVHVTTTYKKYGWVPDPIGSGPITFVQRPPDCQGSETQTVSFTTVTTGHLSMSCRQLTGNIFNGEPSGVRGSRFFIKFTLKRYLVLTSVVDENTNGLNAFLLIDQIPAIGGGSVNAIPEGIGWPGGGTMTAQAEYIEYNTPSVTVVGQIFNPPPISNPNFNSPPLLPNVTFSMSDWVEIT